MKILTPLIALALLAGCASNPTQRDAEQLSLYRQHAGAPVPSFRYFGRMSSWTPLGSDVVAVWTTPSRAYLIDVDGPCNDLPFAQAIRLSESAGTVNARFDHITPIGGAGMQPLPCRIREIRPIDVPALREARRQAKASR